MEKRVAIITGATKGIGRGLFLRLSSLGVNIATIYHRDEKAAEEFKKDAENAGVRCLIQKCNVSDYQGLCSFVEKTYNQFGRIDFLINNIGVDVFKKIEDVSWDEWKLSQDIILNAPVYLCKVVLPYMRMQKFGRIVNIGASSKDYYKGAPGLGPFGIHKAALTVFTKTLALEEIQNGITVNMVAPGSTRGAGSNPEEKRIPISQIPLGRRVEVEEVVDAILYFLSNGAGAVTGQYIGVNGGLST